MASSTMISVPTTASRFALLHIDSDSDSDASGAAKSASKGAGKGRQGKNAAGAAARGKAALGNDKKKDKKKKRKEQQQSETNELRSLAFKKLPQKSCLPQPNVTPQGTANGPSLRDPSTQTEGWQQWKQRDEQITTELYEADLEKALILSKLEYEQKRDSTHTSSPKSRGGKEGGKKEKKKNQQGKEKKTVSLQDFQAEGSIEVLSKRQEKEEPSAATVAGAVVQEARFFNKVEDDVSQIIQREKRREQYTVSQGQEVKAASPTQQETDPREKQLKHELEKKDRQIDKLKKTISEWEVKYKEVKARNAQLLKMLQQGEMKDKAEILLQVEELLNIKEELSSQVTLLHAALEQERSKVKGLQTEQPKHQGGKKGKKCSETDQ